MVWVMVMGKGSEMPVGLKCDPGAAAQDSTNVSCRLKNMTKTGVYHRSNEL
jgi:hypothetical protein